MSTKEAKADAPPEGVVAPSEPGGRSGFLSDVIVELGFAERETVEKAVRAARSPGTTVARPGRGIAHSMRSSSPTPPQSATGSPMSISAASRWSRVPPI